MKKKISNIVSFPGGISEIEREIEAILFASNEPMDVNAIESKISKKKQNIEKSLEKLQAH